MLAYRRYQYYISQINYHTSMKNDTFLKYSLTYLLRRASDFFKTSITFSGLPPWPSDASFTISSSPRFRSVALKNWLYTLKRSWVRSQIANQVHSICLQKLLLQFYRSKFLCQSQIPLMQLCALCWCSWQFLVHVYSIQHKV